MNRESALTLLRGGRDGVTEWNAWREEDTDAPLPELDEAELRSADLRRVDLRGVNLRGADLRGANLRGARLRGADLTNANLEQSDLVAADLGYAVFAYPGAPRWERVRLNGASLTDANLLRADLSGADFSGATLRRAHLRLANLHGADLNDADLTEANLVLADLTVAKLCGADLTKSTLERADLTRADVEGAVLTDSRIHGISVWGIRGVPRAQTGLLISRASEARIPRHFATPGEGVTAPPTSGARPSESGPQREFVKIDDIRGAALGDIMLNDAGMRTAIDVLGKKGVLILGRFTKERVDVLRELRSALRQRGFMPMLFEFDRPDAKDLTETVMVMAGLSVFIVADITNPKSAPLELQAVVPSYMTPLVPIIHQDEKPFAMFEDLIAKNESWVLPTLVYDTVANLLGALDAAIVDPALELAEELRDRKARTRDRRHVSDYLPDADDPGPGSATA